MNKTILYIEDNHDNMTLVQKALRAAGYQFLGAPDGLSGLDMVSQHDPDLILLDINLPDIDGYEVARRLRAQPQPPRAPIVALTAHALKGDGEKALAAGCDAYIVKPINVRELQDRIGQFLS
jgi:two-component system cell cycle response regulator DivK